eukprot:m.154961 g.154961  ORF g.154961 m.154961 type:complete len:117 (-) comp16264_c1_seq7:905-1255(-)
MDNKKNKKMQRKFKKKKKERKKTQHRTRQSVVSFLNFDRRRPSGSLRYSCTYSHINITYFRTAHMQQGLRLARHDVFKQMLDAIIFFLNDAFKEHLFHFEERRASKIAVATRHMTW